MVIMVHLMTEYTAVRGGQAIYRAKAQVDMKQLRHILIVTALPFEGACITKHLGLQPVDGRLTVYSKAPYHLVVSGVGKVRAAAATGALCCSFPPESIDAVVNLGIAGSTSPIHPVGSRWLIHQIRDGATFRHYYPDMLASHPMRETSLTTLDKPATEETLQSISQGLVDMEASGFYEAASMFVGPEKIISAKVVSDIIPSGLPQDARRSERPSTQPRIDVAAMNGALSDALPEVFAYVNAVCECNRHSRAIPLNGDHRKYMENLIDILQLTRTQQEQLRQTVCRFVHKYPDATLPEFIPARVTTARERNQYFAQFQKELLR
jgi:hypothetical protein